MGRKAINIIKAHPEMPFWVAEEMIAFEEMTGEPYGDTMDRLIEKYGGEMTIFEYLGYE